MFEFAERFPWVQLYTPINEMFICAVFSAKYGWWNEQKKDDRSFITALKHIVKANVMAMIEILKRRHDAIFIQSESSEYYHADSPGAIGRAEVLNQMRFLSLDLNYGRRVDSSSTWFRSALPLIQVVDEIDPALRPAPGVLHAVTQPHRDDEDSAETVQRSSASPRYPRPARNCAFWTTA